MTQDADIESNVVATLNGLGIPHEIIRIDPDFADTAQFCEEYGYSLAHCANTIIVGSRRGPKQFSACVVLGTDRLDVNRTVKGLMSVSRASFASPEDTMELTGMMIGGVTPFALPDDLPIYADQRLLDVEYLIFGSGTRSSKLKLAPADLSKIPNLQFVPGLSLPRE